jgi:cell division protein ZapA
MSDTLDIEVLGKTYRIACTPDERESLSAAVEVLQHRLENLRGKARAANERLAIMVALEMAHEMVQRQRGEIAAGVPLAGDESLLAPEELKGRIKSIEARMIAALEPNEKLF